MAWIANTITPATSSTFEGFEPLGKLAQMDLLIIAIHATTAMAL
jgi:hypothetical protein